MQCMRGPSALAIILILGILGSASAQMIENPQLVESASITINENGSVIVAGGAMRDIWIKIPIPVSSPYQQVQVNSAYKTDANGNPYVEIKEDNPTNPYQYGRVIDVQTIARKTESLPERYAMGKEEMRFLSPTEKTQSKDQKIVAMAANITAGADDDFEKVARLAVWVNSNVRYNEFYLGQEESASAVLQHRQGVCYEFSTLFAALARASGIPARYITGYVYSEKFATWLGHAWTEVYLGEWVPVDPTWLEVGTTDALHVESAKYLEMEQEGNLIANIYPPTAQLEWETNGRSGALAANIITREIVQGEQDAAFRLEAAAPRIAPGQKTLVFLEIEGKDFRVLPVSLASCTGDWALNVENEKQYVILRPGRKSVVAWEISTLAGLSSSYYYTCPLTLNSPYLEPRVVEVKVDPRLNKLPDFEAKLQQEEMESGGQNAVLLTLPEERRGKKYYVVADGGAEGAYVSAQSALIPFYSYGQGRKMAYAAGEGGGYVKLEYGIAEGAGSDVSIDSFFVPEMIVGKEAVVEALISAKEYPASMDATLNYGGRMLEKSGIIEEQTLFLFEFAPEEEGPLAMVLSLKSGENESISKNAFANVGRQPEVMISKVSSIKSVGKGDMYDTSIALNFSGEPSGVAVEIGGQAKKTDGGIAMFLLPQGEYSTRITWLDAAGNQYERNEIVKVGTAGLFEAIAPKAGAAQNGACPLALFAILLPFAFMSSRRR